MSVERITASILMSMIGPNIRKVAIEPGMKVPVNGRMNNASTLAHAEITNASTIVLAIA